MRDELDVGMKCIKYMLFVANFMFLMIGFLLISIGTTIKTIYGDFDFYMETNYFSPSILTIVIGVIIAFVALFGCVGAFKQSTFLINMFAIFLTLILILEIAAAIAAYCMRNNIEDSIRANMEDSFSSYYMNDYDRDIVDFTQQRLLCCGIDNYNYWTQATSTVSPSDAFFTGPNSCCRTRDLRDGQCLRARVFKDGCVDDLTYLVSESALLLGCGALAVAFIQLLGIIFALMMAKAIRQLKTQELLDRDLDRQRAYEQLSRDKESIQTPVLYTPTFSEA